MRSSAFWIRLSGALLLSLSLAACGGASSPASQAPLTPTDPPALAQAPTSEPSAMNTPENSEEAAESGPHNDTLRLLWWQAATILNPHLASGNKDWDASRITYEPLATFDREGKMVLFLAAEVPSLENGGVSPDGLSVTWKLKEGVKWSDGQPFSAEDVKFTFDYISDPATGATSFATYSAVERVEVIDELTVKVIFKEPNPAWSQPFVGYDGQILPKHIFGDYIGAEARNAPANMMPVGTGPYRVVEFKPGDVVIYEANPYFREEGKPYFSRIELKGGGDAATAARAVLQTGDIDFAWNLQVENQLLEQLVKDGVGELLFSPSGSSERIVLNTTDPNTEINDERSSVEAPHPFFSDKRVRQAFALAIDRDTIAKQLYGLSGYPTANMLFEPPIYESPNTSYEYNLAKAAALLDEAGWVDSDGDGVREKDGKKLSILFQTSVNPIRQKTQEIIKASLTQIGFEVELKSVDNSVFFSGDAGNPDTMSHFYADVQMFTTGNGSPEPNSSMLEWVCWEIAQQSNQWSGRNITRWCNPEFDALYNQAKAELDPQKRAELFIKMNDLLIEDVAIIPLVRRTFPTGASKTLEGVELTPWDSNTWLIKEWKRKS